VKKPLLYLLLSVILCYGMTASAQVLKGKGHKIMIFAGENHKIYLGCLSCNEFASDSVLNEFGHSGSQFSSESIFNHFSQYGSEFSRYSACNSYASDPPVIVDENGNYYGRLTLNLLHPQIGVGNQLTGWLESICKS
jgi:hypothetical protein